MSILKKIKQDAIATNCCATDAWRGKFCSYHQGFYDGYLEGYEEHYVENIIKSDRERYAK